MITSRKLKPDRSIFGPIQPVIVLAIFGLAIIIWGIENALNVLIFIYLVYFLFTMYTFFRVKNFYFIPVALFQLVVAVFFAFNGKGPFTADPGIIRGISILMVCTIAMSVYVMITKKIKWRGRELFELVAQNVEADPESYTERPRPSGKIEYNRSDLLGFARFYERNLLGICRNENNSLIFIPVMMNQYANTLYNPSFNYRNHTYITIDPEGSVTTFISKNDYFEYKEDLAFDQLSASMGDMHVSFLEWYREGKGVRIMDKINEINMNIFT